MPLTNDTLMMGGKRKKDNIKTKLGIEKCFYNNVVIEIKYVLE